MLSNERLKEIAAQPFTCAQDDEVAEMACELLSLRWRPITESDLPKVGDEVLSRFMSGGCRSVQRGDWKKTYDDWMMEFSHFRAINPPQKEPA